MYPAAQRRAGVRHPLGGCERRGIPEHPDLVPDLVEEALPGVGIGRAERRRLVDDDAGRAEQAGVAAQQPGGELEVVVPQEVVRPRQAPPAAYPGVHEDRDKRCRTDRQAARGRGRQAFCLAGERLAARGVHRVRPPVGPEDAARDQRGGPGRVAFAGGQQRPQRTRLGHRVVIHEPDEVDVTGQGQRRAIGEPARAAGVARQPGQPYGRILPAHRRSGPVGRGVVDHDHDVRRRGLRMHRFKRLEQQLPPVAGDHDRGHGRRIAPERVGAVARAHARNVPGVRAGPAGPVPGTPARPVEGAPPGRVLARARAPATPGCVAGGRSPSGC